MKHVFIRFFFLLSIGTSFYFCLYGCSSVPRHKTLTFFFDGVPEPGENHTGTDSAVEVAKFTGKTQIPDRGEIAKSIVHPPYKEKQCGVCHDQGAMGRLKNTQNVICFQCHEDFNEKYKKVHGPAGSGYCTVCHNPHLADNKNLLIRTGQELCYYCHNSGLVLKNEVHKEIADASCTECHNPHGGDDRSMLK
jgi:predicted CXXCH cytochrome family protein